MAIDLQIELGDDENYWVVSANGGVAVAVCREDDGKWYAAEDDAFFEEIGPFGSLDEICNHIENNKLYQPWGSPGM
jgi:hypothetical protein